MCKSANREEILEEQIKNLLEERLNEVKPKRKHRNKTKETIRRTLRNFNDKGRNRLINRAVERHMN